MGTQLNEHCFFKCRRVLAGIPNGVSSDVCNIWVCVRFLSDNNTLCNPKIGDNLY